MQNFKRQYKLQTGIIMKIQTTIILFCLLLFMTAGAVAQTGTIEGTVTDAATGEVMAGVNVSLIGTTKGAATNA